MKRVDLSSTIVGKLSDLYTRVGLHNRGGFTDTAKHLEGFSAHLLNALFGLNLSNANILKTNQPGYDLIDSDKKVIVQVTSVNGLEKLKHTLSKIRDLKLEGYHLYYFVAATSYTGSRDLPSDLNIESIEFDPTKDILDLDTLNKHIVNASIETLKEVANIVEQEIKDYLIAEGSHSGVAAVVSAIAKKKFSDNYTPLTHSYPNIPDIDQKLCLNELEIIKEKVKEESTRITIIDEVYNQFDSEGQSLSSPILYRFNSIYLSLKDSYYGDELFYAIRNQVLSDIEGDLSISKLFKEQKEYFVELLLIDAFIRCKIFKRS